LSNAPLVDVAGSKMLVGLQAELAKQDVRMRIVEARAKVRDILRAEGIEDQVGYLGRHISVHQAIVEFQSAAGNDPQVSQELPTAKGAG
jgi:hypothetical protein